MSLQVAAAGVRGKGAASVREVAQAADGRAANAFESMLRAHAIRAELDVVPQHPVPLPGLMLHPDLVDVARRLVLEAWTVLRFTWRQVMHDPDWVLACLHHVAGDSSGGQTARISPGSTVHGRVCPP